MDSKTTSLSASKSFEEILQNYRRDAVSDKTIRVKFEVISKDSLPYLEPIRRNKTTNNSLKYFVVNSVVSDCRPRHHQTKSQENSQKLRIIKLKNQMSQLQLEKQRVERRLLLAQALQNISNDSRKRLHEIVDRYTDCQF